MYGMDENNASTETQDFHEMVISYQKMLLLPQHMTADEVSNYAMLIRRHTKASLEYAAPAIPMRVHFFEASQVTAGNPLQSWQKFLPKEVMHVISVPGTHQSMVESPHVECLSAALSEALKETRAVRTDLNA
jgi:thioesterase domain-containing protein